MRNSGTQTEQHLESPNAFAPNKCVCPVHHTPTVQLYCLGDLGVT